MAKRFIYRQRKEREENWVINGRVMKIKISSIELKKQRFAEKVQKLRKGKVLKSS